MAIDLFCGLGGWTDGLLAEGYEVIGYDIEAHEYGEHHYPARLVIQDVLTLHGSEFKDATLIVASPPCQEFSYMAMPWSRAKQIARALRGKDEFPEGYTGSRTIKELTALFDSCFRIQREACEAAGRHIPMVVENVRGAVPWVGRSRWNFGSFHLWGDVPALMPIAFDSRKHDKSGWRENGTLVSSNRMVPTKVPGLDWSRHGEPDYKPKGFNVTAAQRYREGQKLPGNNAPRMWSERRTQRLADGLRHDADSFYCASSGSTARKAASAMIAKIPLPLSLHIARTFKPKAEAA